MIVFLLTRGDFLGAEQKKIIIQNTRPKDIVSIGDINSKILVEARYFTNYNFVGKVINGYQAPKCFLTLKAAKALSKVQTELENFGLGLKVYDCYRPVSAVQQFSNWAKDLNDRKMKKAFYPNEDKSLLFDNGYIAERSGHSRGSTVDLTIVKLDGKNKSSEYQLSDLKDCRSPLKQRVDEKALDMGTAYDCLDVLSHTANEKMPADVAINRLLLKSVMEKQGFRNYRKEWWHFSLNEETYPNTYFNFPVK